MLPHLGPLEIGLILVLVFIIFGAGKLTDVMRAAGKGVREFHKAKSGEEEATAPTEFSGQEK